MTLKTNRQGVVTDSAAAQDPAALEETIERDEAEIAELEADQAPPEADAAPPAAPAAPPVRTPPRRSAPPQPAQGA